MAAAPAATEPSGNATALFAQLDAYPWDTDDEFQGGLRAILGSVDQPEQAAHLTLRAKCYYFARKVGAPVDFDGYKDWVESGHSADHASTIDMDALPTMSTANSSSGAPVVGESGSQDVGSDTANNGVGDAPRPATFAEICDMIAEGKPIPGIKDIPNTILEGQASDSSTAQRKKPWERPGSESSEQPSWMT